MNAGSSRNKLVDIFDFVCEYKLNLLAITETWLNANDDVVRNELCPINYKLYDHPRTDRTGGGTALLYSDSLHVKKIGAGQKESFEFSERIVQQPSSHNIRVVTLCSTTLFRCARRAINIFQFSELADYLESTELCKEQLLIWGDFDIHVDIAVGADAIKLID